MKRLRQVNRFCNAVATRDKSLREKCQAVLSTNWYQKSKGMDKDSCLTWKYFTLRRFRFYRHSDLFKMYWKQVTAHLTHLTIQNSSLECIGFTWILSNSPQLQSLVMDGVKLKDSSYTHIGKNRLAPNHWGEIGTFAQPIKIISMENMSTVEPCFMDYLVQRTGT